MTTKNTDGTEYTVPVITDFGDLISLTQASGFTGPEDGGNKLSIHHVSMPIGP